MDFFLGREFVVEIMMLRDCVILWLEKMDDLIVDMWLVVGVVVEYIFNFLFVSILEFVFFG